MNATALKRIAMVAAVSLLWVGCSDECPCHNHHSHAPVAVSAADSPTTTAPADGPPAKSPKLDRPVRPTGRPKTKLADSPDTGEMAPDKTNEADPNAEPQVPAADSDSAVAEVAKAASAEADPMQDVSSAPPIEGSSETAP